jgi:hypothetical protein
MTRFEPGDRVRFTCSSDLIDGEVEEVRRGHDGNHLLVVREGDEWSGDRYVVLSSYAEPVAHSVV